MKKMFVFSMSMIFLVAVIGIQPGICDDLDPSVYAIQEKIFHRYHEIDAYIAYIPDDDFYEAYPYGIGYTYHFNDLLGVDIRGLIVTSQEKDIKGNLENEFGVTPEKFDEPKQMVHAHAIIKPFYGKKAFRNRGIINDESYFFVGGGFTTYEKQYSLGTSRTEDSTSISFGIGTKYFISKNLCLNLEVRDMMNYKDDTTINNIWFGVSFGFRFNFSARKTEQDETLEKLNRYLGDDQKNEK